MLDNLFMYASERHLQWRLHWKQTGPFQSVGANCMKMILSPPNEVEFEGALKAEHWQLPRYCVLQSVD